MGRYVCKVRIKPDEAEWHCRDLERGIEIRRVARQPSDLTQFQVEMLRSLGAEVDVEPG
jgi:hypothetical protein